MLRLVTVCRPVCTAIIIIIITIIIIIIMIIIIIIIVFYSTLKNMYIIYRNI